ncbi:MAG: septum formation initiator family protein [Bacteroidetes bacterium]|nr:septum formation initiator family protein [Bacteroidota bacterium]
MFRKIYNKIPRFIKNKYFIVLLIFVVWMFFLDRNNILSQLGLRGDLHKLRKEKEFYLKETANDSIELQRLMNDSMEAEKLGRERYMMKKDSEDIFLIVRKPAIKK